MAENKLEKINTKNDTYYFLDDLIDINDWLWKNIVIDKKSYRDISIYYLDTKFYLAQNLNILF